MKHIVLPLIAISGLVFAPPAWAQDGATQNAGVAGQDEASQQDADGNDFLNADIDTEAPLAPLSDMPDMELDWPDFEALPPLPDIAAQTDADSNVADSLADAPEISPPDTVQAATREADAPGPDADRPDTDHDVASRDFEANRGQTYEYDVTFDYLDSGEFVGGQKAVFEQRFAALSKLRGLDNEGGNVAQIRRRAVEDQQLLDQLVRNYGYYDADIYQAIDQGRDPARLNVEFGLQLGPVYTFREIVLKGLEAAGPDAPQLRRAFGLAAGDPVNSDAIVAAETRLDEGLAENGYAFAKIGDPDLLIDHAARTGDLTIPVTPAGKYAFGQIMTAMRRLMSARHIQRIARFRPGDVYQRSRLEDLRRALLATGLVSSLRLTPVPAAEAQPDGGQSGLRTVDIRVDPVAAPPRTVAGELGYGSGEGVRAELSWEHRNLFPPEGLLRVRGVAGTQEQLASVLYRRNNFQKRDQVLTAQLLASNINRNAFDARTLLFRTGIERQTNLIFQKTWTWSLGTELILTDERDITADNLGTRRRTFVIGALPATLNYDGSNDLLDPTTGFRLGGELSPEVSLLNGTFGYARAQIDASYYQPVSGRVVIAGRTRFATILGASLLSIAPSRRLYAGGGGSVRGYEFQALGPRDINNDPIGGRSLAEFSLEARVRFGNFGVVPFVDAGNIYSDVFPGSAQLRYGAGVGLRYYSSFGPIRIDVGTPLNPQPGDSRIGVYISLGQAF